MPPWCGSSAAPHDGCLARKRRPARLAADPHKVLGQGALQNGAGGTRTHDLRFRKPSLYPAELQPHIPQPIASSG